MKKVEILIFLILVNVSLMICGSISKGTKNSHTFEEKLQKKKNLTDAKYNDTKEVETLDQSTTKENDISLRKLETCGIEEVGVGYINCDDNNGNCSECDLSYYLLETGSKSSCDTCPNYCCNCSNSTHCLICYYNYFENEGQCKKCSNICKSCNNLTTCNNCYTG